MSWLDGLISLSIYSAGVLLTSRTKANFKDGIKGVDDSVNERTDVSLDETYVATGGHAGLLSSAFYTLLNAATSAATVSTLMKRDGSGRAKVADPSASDDIDTKGARDAAITAAALSYGVTGEMAAAANANSAGSSAKVARIDHTHEISAASGAAAGTMSAADFTKLAGIASGADVTEASVANSYTAADAADWDGNAPTTIKAALDRIADMIGPIP